MVAPFSSLVPSGFSMESPWTHDGHHANASFLCGAEATGKSETVRWRKPCPRPYHSESIFAPRPTTLRTTAARHTAKTNEAGCGAQPVDCRIRREHGEWARLRPDGGSATFRPRMNNDDGWKLDLPRCGSAASAAWKAGRQSACTMFAPADVGFSRGPRLHSAGVV